MVVESAPRSADEFKVAVVCASPLEAEMVQYAFDIPWIHRDINLEQARGDKNTYILGTIGKHNVVLVLLRGTGNTNAAVATAGLRASFSNVEIVIAVGRCGIVPQYTTAKTHEDVFLGDCIISTGVVQYDFGRQYPKTFLRKTGKEDTLAHQNLVMQALITEMQTDLIHKRILAKTALYLEGIQRLTSKAVYPGAHNDRLFDASYLHTHHMNSKTCERCIDQTSICTQSCDVLGCRKAIRQRLADYDVAISECLPRVHFGRYGSGSVVIQSGMDRDRLAMDGNIIAFEMEGAGLWNSLPTIIVKSGCNYADSHKSMEWQPYAAATAAAVMKAFLENWPPHEKNSKQG